MFSKMISASLTHTSHSLTATATASIPKFRFHPSNPFKLQKRIIFSMDKTPSITSISNDLKNQSLKDTNQNTTFKTTCMDNDINLKNTVKLNKLEQLKWDNSFVRELPGDSRTDLIPRQVYGACYSKVSPSVEVDNPQLVAWSDSVAESLELDPKEFERPDFPLIFSGASTLDGMKPYAQCYGGHQFGMWAGQLGDGRAITLGEILNSKSERWELQLKGAGRTPYSRFADGLAVLRSSIREFLCSEAMHGLVAIQRKSLVQLCAGLLNHLLGSVHTRFMLQEGRTLPLFARWLTISSDVENTFILSHHFYSLLLQKCTKLKSLKQCKQIHASIITNDLNPNILSLSSKLIGAYASCQDFETANSLFQETKNPNAFAFNMIITSLNSTNSHKQALYYFSLFAKSITCFNELTFIAILKSCVGLLDLKLGKQIHGTILKLGFQWQMLVCNSLVDMYGKCGDICFAGKVFDEMPERDVVSWTTMICRFFDVGKVGEAVELFARMRGEGVDCNDFTWNAVIAGCAKNGDCDLAFAFFREMGEQGLFPDLVTWNAMICGFVQNGRGDEGLSLFIDMLDVGIRPNEVTVTGGLPSCGMIGSVEKGREIHGLVYRLGLDVNVFVGSALIDMYSKCGSVEKALLVFNNIRAKNVASWNAMIACYGKHGMVDCALKLFEKMWDEGILANEVTLTSVLSACSHGGQVERGLEIFRKVDVFDVKANADHYACIVDLLCRYGRMNEALVIVKELGEEVTDSIIGAFLNGCRIHERKDLAENISEYLKMELKRPGGFVTLANINASVGKWGGVENVRKVMKDKKVHKKPGFSST